MTVNLLTEHHLEFFFLLKWTTLVKMSNCWKSHAAAQMLLISGCILQGMYKIRIL